MLTKEDQRKQRKWREWVWKRREGDRRGPKEVIMAYHWEYNVYRSNSPVKYSPCRRIISEIKGQLAPRPAPRRRLAVPGKTVLQCLLRWLRRGIVHLFAKKNWGPFQAFKKAKMFRTTLQRWPLIHNNKDVISWRVGVTLLCTSVGLAAWFLIFIYIVIYFDEKPSLFSSPVQRSAEDESVILHRKHSSAW